MKVNLIPDKANQKNFKWSKIIFWSLILLMISSFTLNYYLLYHQLFLLQSDIKKIDSLNQLINPKLKEYYSLQEKLSVLTALNKELKKTSYYWDELIKEYGYIVPGKAMLNYLRIEEDSIKMLGSAVDNQQVIDLINNMQTSPFFNIVKINKVIGKDEINFDIKANYIKGGEPLVEETK